VHGTGGNGRDMLAAILPHAAAAGPGLWAV
jgi:hypothetical protein